MNHTPSNHNSNFPTDFPGQCYLEEYKTAVKPGDVFSVPGKCMDLRCAEDLKSIFGTGCGTFAVAPPCTISDTDYSKPFPECCPQAVCPKE